MTDPFEALGTKAKRKKSTSPTARTLEECRKRGWTAAVVEKFVRFPPPGHLVDLFGVIDIIAMVPPVPPGEAYGSILAIQTTANTGGAHAARRDKILAEDRIREWIRCRGRFELWSWAKQGARGSRKLWTLRVETYADMVRSASQ